MAERPDLSFEGMAIQRGYCQIAGIDEAGRGCLAGPVVAAAVIFPEGLQLDGVDDSKRLSPRRREVLFDQIQSTARSIAVGVANVGEIERLNILQATRLAMSRAVGSLSQKPDYLLIDAVRLSHIPVPQEAIVKGDSRCHAIAAASIVAKVTRDRMMVDYHTLFPQYHFISHKGYGTKVHVACLQKYGPSEIHRRTFLSKVIPK